MGDDDEKEDEVSFFILACGVGLILSYWCLLYWLCFVLAQISIHHPMI